MGREPAKILTIGGSDSGGAAGIQADIKTVTALGCYAMSVLTVVTAQDSQAVRSAHFLPPEFVVQQLEAVLSDYGAAAIKTGFIGNVAIIEAIAARLKDWQGALIIDPVLVNHRAEPMFGAEVTAAYRDHLLPQATLVTPNLAELGVLIGRQVSKVDEMEAAGRSLLELGPAAVLIKGGRNGDQIWDLLLTKDSSKWFPNPIIVTNNRHGSGDTLSAAIATNLAQGKELAPAIEAARHFTYTALDAAKGWQLGAGHGPVAQWLAG